MFSIRYTFRLIKAFLTRFRALIFLGIVFGVLMFFVINMVIPSLASKKVEKIGITGRHTPSSLPISILSMVSDGLTMVDASGIASPSLAKSWETPDKGKTWVFTLKEGRTWQDEKPVKSGDINYDFSDLTIEHPDDSTVVFKLQTAYSAFPSVVAKPVFKKGLLGTGDWTVKNIKLAGGIVTELTVQNTTKETKIFKFYPTDQRTKVAFELGEVDKIEGLLDPTPIDSWPRIKIDKEPETTQYVVIFFNTSDKFLGEKSLRQALSYAIDKKSLPGKRAISPISENSWAYNPQVKPYTFDSEKAKKTISELPSDITNDLKIKLTTSPALLATAESVAKNWRDVGVTTEVSATNSIPQDYQALLVVFDIPEDPDQYSLWHSTQTSTNVSHYSNPRIDKLLEDGRTELDLEERKKIYLDFQRFLLEDAPAVFLYYPYTYTITR